MQFNMLKAKIHRATITEADLRYVGSITIDETLMNEAGIHEYEKVQVVDIQNGNRFETYVIRGERDSGCICVNGAAARLVSPGDHVIIMAYCTISSSEMEGFLPRILFVDDKNSITSMKTEEIHGDIV